ncbi:MAG: hypothetical protein JOZ62_19195 [Acidobacteriaceae bacterium]|nr:hypothetical protein [Acidobacteriaceae bacterium]
MELTITQLRRDLFKLIEATTRGEDLNFVHKGRHFKVVPTDLDKLARITPLQIVNPEYPEMDMAELKAEMQTAWEKDWSEL